MREGARGTARKLSTTPLRLWLQMIRCTKLIERELNVRLRRHYAQSLPRFDVLSQLRRAPGRRLAVGKLSAQLILSNRNITRLLDRMESEGLIGRRYSKTDRRGVEVELTGKGIALFDEMAADHAQWVEGIFSRLPKQAQASLHMLLADAHSAAKREF